MTLRKPDENSPLRWIFSELRPGTLVVALATGLGAYYGVSTQVALLQQQQSDQARQIEQLNRAMDGKLNKEVYETGQQATQIQLKGISDTVDRIEQSLIDHPGRK